MSEVLETNAGRVRIIQLNHATRHNPFSKSLERAVIEALGRADEDDGIDAIVVYGGKERSFSAGGDFNEVKNLSTGAEIDAWIDRVTDLYVSALKLKKPSVAAVDGFAIGMGFQFAMMFDWRVMARDAELRMPELKHGIGCSVGAAILGKIVGWNAMREIIYRADAISAQQAWQNHLVNDLADSSSVLAEAIARAEVLAGYPQAAFRSTKLAVNRSLIDALTGSAAESKQVHRAAFLARDAQKHFQNILGEKYSAVSA